MVVRHLSLLLSGKALRVPVGIVLTGLMARLLGPEEVGRWTMLLGAATLMHTALLSWTQSANIRFGREEWRQDGRLTRTWASRWPFLLAGMVLAGSAIIFNPWDWYSRFFHLTATQSWLLIAALVGLWLAAESQSLFQVRGEILLLGYWAVFADLAVLIALLGSVWAELGQMALFGALLLAGGAVWWVGCTKSWGKAWPGLPIPHIDGLHRTWRYAGPMIPGVMVGYVSDWCDQLLLSRYFDLAEVGIFQMAYQIFIMTMGLAGVVGTLLLPHLIDRGSDVEPMRNFVSRYVPTLLALWGVCIIPVTMLVPPLLPYLLGHDYEKASDLIALLVIAVPGSVVTFVYGALYSLQGRLFRSSVVLAGMMSATNLILSLYLVPRWGGYGAAIATAVSYLLIQFLYVYDQHGFLGVSSNQVLLILVALLPFSLTQGLLEMGLGMRLVLATLAIILVTAIVRYCRIARADVLRSVLGMGRGCIIIAKIFRAV